MWQYQKDITAVRLPVKTLQSNRCPAVAPLSVLDSESKKRLAIDMVAIHKHHTILKTHSEFSQKLQKALEIQHKDRQTELMTNQQDVDARLYDGFFDTKDKNIMRVIRAADPSDLLDLQPKLSDDRLRALLPLYKARNYPSELTTEERGQWEAYREQKLLSGGAQSQLQKFVANLQKLVPLASSSEKQYLLEELQLYAESIMPDQDYSS